MIDRKILYFIRHGQDRFVPYGDRWILEHNLVDVQRGHLAHTYSTASLLECAPEIVPVYDTAEETLRSLPVGNIEKHTTENLPELVAYHVKRSAFLGSIEDDVDDIYYPGGGVSLDKVHTLLKKIQQFSLQDT